jgi:hypothetical protein
VRHEDVSTVSILAQDRDSEVIISQKVGVRTIPVTITGEILTSADADTRTGRMGSDSQAASLYPKTIRSGGASSKHANQGNQNRHPHLNKSCHQGDQGREMAACPSEHSKTCHKASN